MLRRADSLDETKQPTQIENGEPIMSNDTKKSADESLVPVKTNLPEFDATQVEEIPAADLEDAAGGCTTSCGITFKKSV
jgi:hypothetical protein